MKNKINSSKDFFKVLNSQISTVKYKERQEIINHYKEMNNEKGEKKFLEQNNPYSIAKEILQDKTLYKNYHISSILGRVWLYLFTGIFIDFVVTLVLFSLGFTIAVLGIACLIGLGPASIVSSSLNFSHINVTHAILQAFLLFCLQPWVALILLIIASCFIQICIYNSRFTTKFFWHVKWYIPSLKFNLIKKIFKNKFVILAIFINVLIILGLIIGSIGYYNWDISQWGKYFFRIFNRVK